MGKSGAYVYHFCREIPGEDHPGAFHSSELWYVFGTLMRSNRPFTGVDYDLSLQMTDWWVNFARTGNPGDGWTAYTEQHPEINWIDKKGSMRSIRSLPQADAESDAMIERIYG